jgi:hypothetical protein
MKDVQLWLLRFYLNARYHSQEAFLGWYSENREVFLCGLRADVRAEQPVPDRENKTQVFVRKAPCPVVNSVVVGGDKRLLGGPQINPDVGVYPDIDYNAY